MRMCSTLALISCNVALRGRREGGGGRDMYVEKESGTVGSTVGEERGGRCRAQMIEGSFRCHVWHATSSAYGPHLPYTHTQTTCTCIYTHLFSAIHIVAVRKLIQWLYFSLDHFFYSEKLYLGKDGTIVLSDQPNPFTASHT